MLPQTLKVCVEERPILKDWAQRFGHGSPFRSISNRQRCIERVGLADELFHLFDAEIFEALFREDDRILAESGVGEGFLIDAEFVYDT